MSLIFSISIVIASLSLQKPFIMQLIGRSFNQGGWQSRRGRIFLILFFTHSLCFAAPITLMLDPAGDVNHALREIDDVYERGLTLKCAEAIQKKLERENPDTRVILTRLPGDSLEPLQNANFANRLAVDCYLTIHFYKETEAKPHCYVYYYLNNAITDGWKTTTDEFVFIPYDQAHKKNLITTKIWGNLMIDVLSKMPYTQQFDCKGLLGVPHKALVGIQAPAFCVEASLKTKDDWQVYVEPLVHSY